MLPFFFKYLRGKEFLYKFALVFEKIYMNSENIKNIPMLFD